MKKLLDVLVCGVALIWLFLSYVWGIAELVEVWEDYTPKIKNWFRRVFHRENPEYVSEIDE